MSGRFVVQKIIKDEWRDHGRLHDYRDAKASCERIARGGGSARVIEAAIDPPVVLCEARPRQIEAPSDRAPGSAP